MAASMARSMCRLLNVAAKMYGRCYAAPIRRRRSATAQSHVLRSATHTNVQVTPVGHAR